MDPRAIRIYSSEDSPRLRYILSLIIGDFLGLSWELTTDRRRIKNRVVINYSNDEIPGSFRIIPHSLLFEKGVHNRDISVGKWHEIPVFFESAISADFPFDIFAASFYLVTRYEEYLDFAPDEHGRFRSSDSIAFRNDFLGLPVIDIWVGEMARLFVRKFRNIAIKRNEFNSLLTVDTDEPFAYTGKNFLESAGKTMNEILHHPGMFRRNSGYKEHKKKDPFDVFEYISESTQKFKSEVIFFFPVCNSSRFDRNPSWKNHLYRSLIASVSTRFKTGLHASYNWASHSGLNIEKRHLAELSGKDITANRFHYIRFTLPGSYRQLIENGITEDYSMGYSDEPGFRAGIARPYFFYDIEREQQTLLKVYPFQVMDETIFNKKRLSNDESIPLIQKFLNIVKSVGGTFISIWHNTTISDDQNGHLRRDVFEYVLKNQSVENALSD
ncbi:MAG TPA: polysaccharide deacetylase family protein [Bacteroidales bacterium]|nr:polysaccharide deacetylase family protein [Bacteroidales bacterium]